jgi:hypothetical protein
MRTTRCCFISLVLAFGQTAWAASGNDGDPTPRKGIDPSDAAVIKQFEAKRWLSTAPGTVGGSSDAVRTNVSGSIPGRQSCNTQIGPSAPAAVGPAGQPTSSPRFGQARNSVVLVTGNVINVCR